jgi:hypothetical protein
LIGVVFYAEVYNLVFEPLLADGLGKMTLNNLFSVSYGVMVLIVVMVAFATFFLLGKIEGKLYK